MLKEFREFILKGNAFDLAVGVIIGAAFGGIVTSLVSRLYSRLDGLSGPIIHPTIMRRLRTC